MQTMFGYNSCWGKTNRRTEELPDYGNIFTMDEFINCCQIGAFIDYDGYGQYATEHVMLCDMILPSYVQKGNNVKNYPFVIWFNR